MNRLSPQDDAPDWTNQNMLHRIRDCLSMLYIHGFVTDKEYHGTRTRINKWCSDGQPARPAEAAREAEKARGV